MGMSGAAFAAQHWRWLGSRITSSAFAPAAGYSGHRAPLAIMPFTFIFGVKPMTKNIFSGPNLVEMPSCEFAGTVRRYDMRSRGEIPAQWDAYNDAGLRAASPDPHEYFGLVFNFDEATGTFDYMCGQLILKGSPLPLGFKTLLVPGGNWAKFSTSAHISTMQSAWAEVMGQWLGQPGCIPREGPSIEYYPSSFNSRTGDGGYEIWMPVA
jgi:AraC family transcriptional regulator